MTTIQDRVDDKLKLQSEYVLRSMEETLQAMQDTMDGKNLHGPYHTIKEMMEALDANT